MDAHRRDCRAAGRVCWIALSWGSAVWLFVLSLIGLLVALDEMVILVEEMIDPTTDTVHLLSSCAACRSRRVARG